MLHAARSTGALALAAAALAVFLLAQTPAGTRPDAARGAATAAATATAPASLDADDLREIAALPQIAARLRARLERAPDDAEGWALLGRTYVALGQHLHAKTAFRNALARRGDDPALLVDYADTLAYLNGRSLEGEPAQLIERALKIAPSHPGALMLAGLAAFDRHDYLAATRAWEAAARSAGQGSPVERLALDGIREAKRRVAAP